MYKGNSRVKDLTGQRFGRLTALYRRWDGKRWAWVCQCDCGVETEVLISNLKQGRTVSCGCYMAEKGAEVLREWNTRLDLTGKRFGRLTVLGLAPERKGFKRQWFCVCDCGTKKLLITENLTRRTHSCGCLQRESKALDLTGFQTPFFKVLGRSKFKNKSGKRQARYWDCLCQCGNEFAAVASLIHRGKVKSCGCRKAEAAKVNARKASIARMQKSAIRRELRGQNEASNIF